jgi:Domain of unknown function (DUF929)
MSSLPPSAITGGAAMSEGSTPVPPRSGRRTSKGGRPSPGQAKGAGQAKVPGHPKGAGQAAGAGPAARRRQAAAASRRRRQWWLAGSAIGVIVVVVVALVVINVVGGGTTKATTPTKSTPVPAATLARLTSITPADLAAAAKGYDLTDHGGSYPKLIDGQSIAAGGKPEVLFVGAEYCPFCATQRWALVLALSKFGTFSGLHFIHSDNNPSEEYRQVPTFSFYGATYHSQYLDFASVETENVNQQPLQTPTAAQQAILDKYDPGTDGNPIPFVYFDGKALINGAEYNPGLLVGKTYDQVVDSIAGGTSALASSVMADAGSITSTICRVTRGRPADVCKAFPTPITS